MYNYIYLFKIIIAILKKKFKKNARTVEKSLEKILMKLISNIAKVLKRHRIKMWYIEWYCLIAKQIKAKQIKQKH